MAPQMSVDQLQESPRAEPRDLRSSTIPQNRCTGNTENCFLTVCPGSKLNRVLNAFMSGFVCFCIISCRWMLEPHPEQHRILPKPALCQAMRPWLYFRNGTIVRSLGSLELEGTSHFKFCFAHFPRFLLEEE